MDLSEMDLRLSVADLLARYQKLADTGRVDDLSLLFAEDAIYETNAGQHVGRPAILDFFKSVGHHFIDSGLLVARHHLSSVAVEPKGADRAATYACFVWIRQAGPGSLGHLSRRGPVD